MLMDMRDGTMLMEAINSSYLHLCAASCLISDNSHKEARNPSYPNRSTKLAEIAWFQTKPRDVPTKSRVFFLRHLGVGPPPNQPFGYIISESLVFARHLAWLRPKSSDVMCASLRVCLARFGGHFQSNLGVCFV